MVLRHCAELHAPPKVSENLQVPILPSRVRGIIPSLLLQQRAHLREQLLPADAGFIPKIQARRAPALFRLRDLRLLRADHGLRRPLEAEPCEVTGPAAHPWLHQRQSRYKQAGGNRVEFSLQPRVEHVGQRDQKSRPEHEVRHNPQGLEWNCQHEHERREREPFDAGNVSCNIRSRRWIYRLEQALAEHSVVDHGTIHQPGEPRSAINHPLPFRLPRWSEKHQMLESQHRLRLAVTLLLLFERAEREPTIMPDDRCRAECNDLPGLLKAPAKVHIVACFAVFRIKPSHALKRPTMEGHVAPRNVLGDHVREEHMARAAGRGGDAGLDPLLGGGRYVRSPHPGVIPADQRAYQVIQPVGICHAVRVRIGEDITGGRRRAGVSRMTQPHVWLHDFLHCGEAGGDLLGVVRGAVIHEHHLVIRIVDGEKRLQAGGNSSVSIVRADDHRDSRVGRQPNPVSNRRASTPLLRQRSVGFLRSAIPRHETKSPICYLRAAGKPFIGPGKQNRSRSASLHDAIHMPSQHLRLLRLGVADCVHAKLPK